MMPRVYRDVVVALLLLVALMTTQSIGAERVPPIAINKMTISEIAQRDQLLADRLRKLAIKTAKSRRERIVVKLAVPWAPDGVLNEWQKTKQRAENQNTLSILQARLPRLDFMLLSPNNPFAVVDIDPGALKDLMDTPGLDDVMPASDYNESQQFVQSRLRELMQSLPTRYVSDAAEKQMPGNVNAPPISRIVGGTIARPGVHPFQVALLQRSIADNFDAQYCGGTLVASRFIVTAAHCVDFLTPDAIQVLAGTQRLDGTGIRLDVDRIEVHPNWDPITFNYDVAILRLVNPITGVPIATLAQTQPTTPGTPMRATGWGTLSDGGSRSRSLLEVDLPYVATIYGSCALQGGITGQMLCAGGQAGKDSCGGDSGGPLTMNSAGEYSILTGIVSFGTSCALANYPGVYTNVASRSIREFIFSRIPSVAVAYTRAGSGQGTVSFSPIGSQASCSNDCTNNYMAGAAVSLVATPATGSRFSGWTGACSGGGACQLNLSANQSVTAVFEETDPMVLTYSQVGSGSGGVSFSPGGGQSNCSTSCTNYYSQRTVVTVAATPDSGSRFAGWSGACRGTRTCRVIMSAARTVTAEFVTVSRATLSYTPAGNGFGKVTFTPKGTQSDCASSCSSDFDAGTVVAIKAVSSRGSRFAGWTGACRGKMTCRVTMDGAKSLVATFIRR